MTPVSAKVGDSPAGTVIGGENEKVVVDASAEPLALEVPTAAPLSVAVSFSELKIPGLLTDTLTDEMICCAESDAE
jgi:hypothetical protein